MRAKIQMTDREILDFLEQHRKVQVATIGSSGSVHLVTLFYRLINDQIAFWTYRRSQKALNLLRDDRITVLVEDGEDYEDLRGVMIRGHARLIQGREEVYEFGLAVAEHAGLSNDATRAMVAAQASKRIAVVVDPEHVVSWDHRKQLQS